MFEFKVGQEVYTEDGRKAEYAGDINGQQFVRIILSRDDEEYGPEEWPSDKLTPVSKVYVTAPLEKLDARVAEMQARISAIREEEAAVRTSVLDLRKQEKEAQAAVAKFPDVQMALDFLEGRITHVLIENYSKAEVVPLQDALVYHEDRGFGNLTENGLKLLCLFGHEKGKQPRWAINRYYDGSGSYTTVLPFRSEDDARSELQRRADEAVVAWRDDVKLAGKVQMYRNAGAYVPDDFAAWLAGMAEAQKAEKIAKLKADLAGLES